MCRMDTDRILKRVLFELNDEESENKNLIICLEKDWSTNWAIRSALSPSLTNHNNRPECQKLARFCGDWWQL